MKLLSLSFGFTVNRPLDTCIHLLQDEDRRFFPAYKVYVSPIDNTLSELYVDETNPYFPVEAKGELKQLEDDKTLVSGEIQQQFGSRVWVLLAFVGVGAIYSLRVAATDNCWGLIALAGFSLLFILEKRTHLYRMLTKIKLMLEPVQVMTRKATGD